MIHFRVASNTQLSCEQKSRLHQFTHSRPTCQRHIKANGDERKGRKSRDELKKKLHMIFLPASLFNYRQINSDFSLDGPMWKRKKA